MCVFLGCKQNSKENKPSLFPSKFGFQSNQVELNNTSILYGATASDLRSPEYRVITVRLVVRTKELAVTVVKDLEMKAGTNGLTCFSSHTQSSRKQYLKWVY